MRYHGEVNIGLGLTREAKQRMGSLAGKISNQNTKPRTFRVFQIANVHC